MTHIQANRSDKIAISTPAELAHQPRLVVHFGTAPDGLPWLLAVDRSNELNSLFGTVCRIFNLSDRSELPQQVREALDTKVASGLMGVHPVSLGGIAQEAYVSRRKTKHIIGPTILAQLLDPKKPPPAAAELADGFTTNVGAVAASQGNEDLIEAVERSITQRRSKRHLLIGLQDGSTHTGAVDEGDKVLRTPREPCRPLASESLESLAGVTAVVRASAGEWSAPLEDWKARSDAIVRAEQSQFGGQLSYQIPRASLVKALVGIAQDLATLHDSERVHCDVAPGNLLLCKEGAVTFDSLDVPIGMPATAATFAWAAPEQIVGQPVDPRTDVYSLGKMATALMDGVPFGEETHYLVPIGGKASRRVKLLKSEGVYLDIMDSGKERAWQVAWQDFLGRACAYDSDKRPGDARAFAEQLAELCERHPPTGSIELHGQFGDLAHMERGESWTFARVVRD